MAIPAKKRVCRVCRESFQPHRCLQQACSYECEVKLAELAGVDSKASTDAGRRRYACIFGMIGQPFWFYSAWQSEQWGIFALCFLYSWAWINGFRSNWLRSAA